MSTSGGSSTDSSRLFIVAYSVSNSLRVVYPLRALKVAPRGSETKETFLEMTGGAEGGNAPLYVLLTPGNQRSRFHMPVRAFNRESDWLKACPQFEQFGAWERKLFLKPI